MNRNAFLTYLFSLCPGAGQMYQGYMKRGLSQILLFVIPIMLGSVFMPALVALSAVVFMYSFFDSINLRAQIVAHCNGTGGPLPVDDFLIHVKMNELNVDQLLKGKPKLVGWGLVILGAIGLYKSVVEPVLLSFVQLLPDSSLTWTLQRIVYSLPGIAIGGLFVLVGLWLIRGDKKQEDDFNSYGGNDDDDDE